MKRIVICCDGTWESRDRGTSNNVTLLAQSVVPTAADGVTQVVYYDAGVGTEWGLTAQLTGGAFGRGLSKNIEDCYRFLVDNFEPDDDVYLFGFSRGAFTARSLGGLIRKCWVLTKANSERFAEAYAIYRQREGGADSPAATSFRMANSHHPADADDSWRQPIRFIGVFDTVGSLGIPGGGFGLRSIARNRYGFHDVQLSSTVKAAFHALAIDERRKPFAPTLWDTNPAAQQEVAQVWFAGVHSDVGGGFTQHGLSDIAFRWMAEQAQRHKLELDAAIIDGHRSPGAPALHDSMDWYQRPLGEFVRPLDGVEVSVDPSVIGFVNGGLPNYHPANLAAYLAAHPGG